MAPAGRRLRAGGRRVTGGRPLSDPPDTQRERCRACGAEFKDLVCEYCGLASRRAEDPGLERAALDEFQILLRRCEPDAQARLLREGFLPALEANLLEAAVQCLPYLTKGAAEPGPAAVSRLEGVLAKLTTLTPNENLERAIAGYRSRLDAYHRADRAALIGAFVMFGVLGLAILAAIVWLVSRFAA